METVKRGKVWTFGDNVNSESIMATGTDFDPVKAAATCLAHYDKEFPANVKPGDIIVAGRNFGNSSSRPAGRALKYLGVAAVLCESSGAIFYRNTWNIGVPIIECPNVSKMFKKGEEAEVNIATGIIKNLTTGETAQADEPISVLVERWAAGGMIEWVKSRRDQYDTLK